MKVGYTQEYKDAHQQMLDDEAAQLEAQRRANAEARARYLKTLDDKKAEEQRQRDAGFREPRLVSISSHRRKIFSHGLAGAAGGRYSASLR